MFPALLYRFIDWLMRLPEDLEQRCFQELLEFEEAQRMPYITTAERIGIEKGLQQGREEGKLIGEILLAQRLLALTIYTEEELQAKSLDELESIFEQFKIKLKLTDD